MSDRPEVRSKLRLLSYSEIETAMTCWARWDFGYGGRLAGDTLRPRAGEPVLSEGQSWGAGVAAWHQNAHRGVMQASWEAHTALTAALRRDYAKQRENGFPVPVNMQHDMWRRMSALLDHHMANAEPLPNLTRLEDQIIVPLPARHGGGRSSRYGFLCYIDGYTTEADDQRWLVEFKLRNRLQDPDLLERARQYRWYAWAEERSDSAPIVGIYIDQRLNEIPHPPKTVQGRKKGEGRAPSHDTRQVILAQDYIDLCRAMGHEPKEEVIEAANRRIWDLRFPLVFRPGELHEAGMELVSASKLIRDLDNGELYPIRNAGTVTCNFCRFKRICANPGDASFVDAHFVRRPPKRLRGREDHPQPEGT
jgi:hypothetical protein